MMAISCFVTIISTHHWTFTSPADFLALFHMLPCINPSDCPPYTWICLQFLAPTIQVKLASHPAKKL